MNSIKQLEKDLDRIDEIIDNFDKAIEQAKKDLDRIDEIISNLDKIYDEKLEQLKNLESEKRSVKNA